MHGRRRVDRFFGKSADGHSRHVSVHGAAGAWAPQPCHPGAGGKDGVGPTEGTRPASRRSVGPGPTCVFPDPSPHRPLYNSDHLP